MPAPAGPGARRAAAAGHSAAAALLCAGLTLLAGCGDGRAPMTVRDASGVAAEVASRAAEAPLVVNLWATWCAPCMGELADFAAVAHNHPGVRFLGVNFDWAAAEQATTLEESRRDAEAAWTKRRMPYPSLFVSESDLDGTAEALDLETAVLPQTLIYRAGRRVAAHEGALDAAGLEALLRQAGP